MRESVTAGDSPATPAPTTWGFTKTRLADAMCLCDMTTVCVEAAGCTLPVGLGGEGKCREHQNVTSGPIVLFSNHTKPNHPQ